MAEKNTGPRKIGATQKAFEIIETLVEMDGAGVSEIANEVEMSKGTVHAHLASLVDTGYVINQNGEYKPSLQFLDLGIYARNSLDVFNIVKPKIDELAEITDIRAQYMVEEHAHAVYLYRAVGDNTVPTNARLGKPRYLHTTAAGKAILSTLPEERVDEIIEQAGLPQITDNTITDPDELKKKLEEIRDRGYSLNLQESIQNVSAIGAPIKSTDGQSKNKGAISISGPSHQMQKGGYIRDELPDILLGVVEEVELNIAYS
jgi:DNA-binding IclR family transcriptional regulator